MGELINSVLLTEKNNAEIETSITKKVGGYDLHPLSNTNSNLKSLKPVPQNHRDFRRFWGTGFKLFKQN
jgi:hypothetical protein